MMEKNNLKQWNHYFDKSQAIPVPRKFPVKLGGCTEQMTLEEFDEDVSEDDVFKGQGKIELEFAQLDKESAYFSLTSSTSTSKTQEKRQGFILNFQGAISAEDNKLILTDQNQPYPIEESTEPPVTESTEPLIKEKEKTFCSNSESSSPCSNKLKQLGPWESKGDVVVVESGSLESSGIGSGESDGEQGLILTLQDDMLHGKPLSLTEAKELKKAVFGSSRAGFDRLWIEESIDFKSKESYELQLYKDGPNALLVCLQAYILKHYLFEEEIKWRRCKTGFAEKAEGCLVSAITDMVWKAGDETMARVAICRERSHFEGDSDYLEDGITERVSTFEFTDPWVLKTFCAKYLDYFRNAPGCILLLYSVLMSRIVQRVLHDLDEESALLEEDGTATQALINLFLTGQATNYVFNGEQESLQRSKDGKSRLLKGIAKRSEIGFLDFEEAQSKRRSEVGSRFKTPLFPIWAARVDDQLITVHSRRRDLLNDWKLERRFDLYCNLGMSRHSNLQQSEIILTLDTTLAYEPDDEEDSVLECTLRTKWNDASIVWKNSTRF